EGVWGRAGPGGIEEVVGRAVPAGAIVDVGDPTTGVLLVAAGNEVAEGGERVRRAPLAEVPLEGVQPPGAVRGTPGRPGPPRRLGRDGRGRGRRRRRRGSGTPSTPGRRRRTGPARGWR